MTFAIFQSDMNRPDVVLHIDHVIKKCTLTGIMIRIDGDAICSRTFFSDGS
jgi:hypothetical protein